MNSVNLSNRPLTQAERDLLQKGLSFCPDADLDTFTVIKDLHLFARKLYYKSLFSKEKDKNISQIETKRSDEALDDLLTLLEEQDPSELIDTIDIESLLEEYIKKEVPLRSDKQAKFKKKLDKFPPFTSNPNLAAFVASTTSEIKKLKRKSRSSLKKRTFPYNQAIR